MRLEDLTPSHLRRAVAIYLAHAWPGEARPSARVAELEGAVTLAELLGRFEQPEAQPEGAARYALRLGNPRYPHMKLVLHEYLVPGEYFLSVDTHDDMPLPPEAPDWEAWQAVRRSNAELKERIEAAWRDAGLPTHHDLRALCDGLARVEREPAKGARLLVVDDDVDVAESLRRLLEARGYEVELAHDGREALERLACGPLPDLVLLDFAMPELDGQEVLARLRGDPRTAELPVLMATATAIELRELRRASGLLSKPYARQVLFAMIRALLGL
jgi:CheY-like chemotaxis protein